jgi:hypothetical protein
MLNAPMAGLGIHRPLRRLASALSGKTTANSAFARTVRAIVGVLRSSRVAIFTHLYSTGRRPHLVPRLVPGSELSASAPCTTHRTLP